MGYFAWVYTRLAPYFEPIMRPLRSTLAGQADGRTLVIGAGTGLDVAPLLHRGISPDLLEPDADLAGGLRERFPTLRVVQATAESMPLPDASYDTVIASLVLCSVTDVPRVLSEVARVLRPGGKFLFTEHVGHSEGLGRWLQHAIEPMWRPLAGGCHLTREIGAGRPDALEVGSVATVRRGLLFPIVQGWWGKPNREPPGRF